MMWRAVFLSACLVSSLATAAPPAQRLEQQTARASALADHKDYREAVSVLERLGADTAITTLPGWPDTLYARARYEALAGATDKALVTLTHAVEMEAVPASDTVANEAAFAALRERAEFKALVARLQREEALWTDNPALATPYKPVLSDEEKIAGLSKIWSEARFNFPFFGRIPRWTGMRSTSPI